MVGYLFLLVVICFFGWRAYLILKKDKAKVDKNLKKKTGGSSSTGEAIPGNSPKEEK